MNKEQQLAEAEEAMAPWELERCAAEGITPERWREMRNATISRLAKELAVKIRRQK